MSKLFKTVFTTIIYNPNDINNRRLRLIYDAILHKFQTNNITCSQGAYETNSKGKLHFHGLFRYTYSSRFRDPLAVYIARLNLIVKGLNMNTNSQFSLNDDHVMAYIIKSLDHDVYKPGMLGTYNLPIMVKSAILHTTIARARAASGAMEVVNEKDTAAPAAPHGGVAIEETME